MSSPNTPTHEVRAPENSERVWPKTWASDLRFDPEQDIDRARRYRFAGLVALVFGLTWPFLLVGVPPSFTESVIDAYLKVTVTPWNPFYWISYYCFRTASRLTAGDASNALSSDNAPILYLRPFVVDGQYGTFNGVAYWPWRLLGGATFEEELAPTFKSIAPFVALGRPGEELRPLGATRLYLSANEWKPTVCSLMPAARLVVVQAGLSSDLAWELQQLVRSVQPTKVFLLLPHIRAVDIWREYQWRLFVEQTTGIFPRELPKRIGAATFLRFDQDWTPVLVTARAAWIAWAVESLSMGVYSRIRRGAWSCLTHIGLRPTRLTTGDQLLLVVLVIMYCLILLSFFGLLETPN